VRQLLAFVYVSWNVHTQVRDVGQIVSCSVEDDAAAGGKGKGKYFLEAWGFDLFRQATLVESVAALRLAS